MLIQKWMSKDVITMESSATLYDAITLFKTRIISVLPLLKDGKLVGIVSEGDIKKASPSDATSLDKFEITSLMARVPVATIMSKPVITIRSHCTIGEAARLMLNNEVSGLPVIDQDGQIEGIITKSDIFRCFVAFTGIAETGQVFAFRVRDEPGVIQFLTDRIRQNGGRLHSVMSSWDDGEEEKRTVFIHVFNLDTIHFDLLIEEFRSTGLTYGADLSREVRRIFN
ncbi:MAG: CBS and ACT domain-containing protein [Desulfopila sp.]|nr:CBS and ACT domain-containing protein [Desulfopila sp.]